MSRVVIVEPRASGLPLMDRAAELGHEVVLLTADRGGRRVPEAHLAKTDQVFTVDTNDDDRVASVIRRLHAERPFDAVLPGFEHYVPLAARLAAGLNLRGLDPRAALGLHHKHRMRQALASAGIDQPRWATATSRDELTRALAHVGLPCVLKPVDLSGSLHIRKAVNPDEALRWFKRLHRCVDDDLERTALPVALVEEYVSGPEYSVEGFVQSGRVRVISVTKKLLASEPSFVEVGHIVPGDLSAEDARGVEAYTRRVLGALGLSLGPFHAEVRLSDRGPLLMEVAARLGGDQIPRLVALALGVDLYEIAVRCYLGLANPEPAPVAGTRRAGVRYFLRPQSRRYSSVLVDERLRADQRVEEITMLLPPDTDGPLPDSSRGRLGHVVVTGSSYDDVRGLLDEFDRSTIFR